MKRVGNHCTTLLAPVELAAELNNVGEAKRFPPKAILFRAGDQNNGVFLICKGKVCLQVPGAPSFDRVFSAGSVLGLPSTFSENVYSLTAASVAECEIRHVDGKTFLDLMRARPDLCRQATDILGQETTFILSAFRKYPQKTAS